MRTQAARPSRLSVHDSRLMRLETEMMLPSDARVTSAVLWRGILVAAPVDAVFLSILAWRIRAATFRRLKWLIVATMATFFAAVWAIVVCGFFWESVYHYLFPAWSRWLLPVAYGLGFGCAGWLSWRLALYLRGSAVVNFCILVGLWGMAGHAWGVHNGLVEKPPMLRGASAEAAVLFSGFEFVFYGGVILAVAALLGLVRERHPRGRSRSAGV